MANYYADFRSNYFAVKDADAFKDWASNLGLEVWTKTDDRDPADTSPATLYGFGERGAESGVPHQKWDEETDEYEDIDFYAELAEHLVDGQVAIVQEVGAEKLRYLVGYSVAVHSDGRQVVINMDEIYARAAEEFGVDQNAIHPAHY